MEKSIDVWNAIENIDKLIQEDSEVTDKQMEALVKTFKEELQAKDKIIEELR